MRRVVIISLVLAVGGGRVAAQNDVLTTLGTTVREAQNSIFMTLASGVAAFAGDKAVFKAASPEQRAAMVKAVVAIARAFVVTPDFDTRYATFRKAQKPATSSDARTGDEAREQHQWAIDLAIKQAVASVASAPPEVRKELEANIAEMKRQLAELNADPAFRAQVDQAAAASAQEAAEEHAKRMATWESEYPVDAKVLIARRLRHFLRTCGDVDFAAKLETGADDKQRFVNPAYERRSPEWKMCFRGGQPAVDAARAAAKEWLEALEH